MIKARLYTREELLEVIAGYSYMIQRSGKDFPTVVLDDIQKSIQFVLKINCYQDNVCQIGVDRTCSE